MDTTDPQAINLAKKRLRQQMRQALRDMSDEQRRLCAQFCPADVPGEYLTNHDAPIMGFLAAENEPDIDDILKISGRPICFPSINWDEKAIQPMQIDLATLKTHIRRHGVREPVGGTLVAPNDLGVIIVPGLAFDRAGARLGRGGGFYDKFLSQIDRRVEGSLPRPFVIGACLALQLVDEVPTFPHDQRMDAIITEQGFTICEA